MTNDESQRERLLNDLAEFRRTIPSDDGIIEITGGWPEKSVLKGDRSGLIRLGLSILIAGLDPTSRRRGVDSNLYAKSTNFKIDEIHILGQNDQADPSQPEQDNTARAGITALLFTFGIIIIATVICAVAYYVIHLIHRGAH